MSRHHPQGEVAAPGTRGGMVLRWQSALIDRLVEAGPPNQVDVLGVGAAGVTHANADGGRMEASMRTLAREVGQHAHYERQLR